MSYLFELFKIAEFAHGNTTSNFVQIYAMLRTLAFVNLENSALNQTSFKTSIDLVIVFNRLLFSPTADVTDSLKINNSRTEVDAARSVPFNGLLLLKSIKSVSVHKSNKNRLTSTKLTLIFIVQSKSSKNIEQF